MRPARPPSPPLSFPHPGLYAFTDGDWQMQDYPGAPGTARQGRTGTIVPATRGGVATQPRAPGHGRPLAAQPAAGHGRLSAALEAPGDDEPLATTARALGHHRLSAAPIVTAPLPAGMRRLRQGVLPRVPANPRTLTYSQSRLNTAQNRAGYSQVPTYPQSRSTASSFPRKRASINRPSQVGSAGATATIARSTTHQVHPAIQVPPHPRSCSTADAGITLQHPARAPPAPCPSFPLARKSTPSPPCGEGAGG